MNRSLAALLTAAAIVASPRAADGPALKVSSVDCVGITVSDLDKAIEFYTGTLPFTKVSTQEFAGRPYELLSGLFGARSRVARLRLGGEEIELTEFLAPRGRAMAPDMRGNDRSFQHIAIVVSDMAKAYEVLRAHHTEFGSTGPQRLPDWNKNAGGIEAFYFRDPDHHYLEIIHFPNGKGDLKWSTASRDLFLGIDHTAIVVDDTEASLRFYRDTLGMKVAGESENYDVEQEHLNNVFGARLRITSVRAAKGLAIELLEYLAPRDGRPAPADLKANDLAHWQTTLVAESLDPLMAIARAHRISLVSPGPVDLSGSSMGLKSGALTRDPDGHGMRIVTR